MGVTVPERLKNTHIGGINSACQTLKISGFRAIRKFSPPAHENKLMMRETARNKRLEHKVVRSAPEFYRNWIISCY